MGYVMKQLGEFQLEYSERAGRIARGPKKRLPVEILVDGEHTVVLVDCGDCRDLLKNKLPGGVLIPIVSVFRTFFKSKSMRNLNVQVDGFIMKRTYNGVLEQASIPEMKDQLHLVVDKFSKRRVGK